MDAPGQALPAALDPTSRNRRSLCCDLKKPEGRAIVLRLVESADGLFEGFRPGVTERLGLGPDDCTAVNPSLVYGRMTGWGQDGPLAHAAGHDLNYIALTGALHAIGRQGGKPVPPLNLIGDYGGGGMLLAFGMVCALLHAQRSGQGQVVDAAMVDGASSLMSVFHGLMALGLHDENTGSSFLGGAAHFYDTYETSDGKYISIASIEPEFYKELVEKAGLDQEHFAGGMFQFQADDKTRERWAVLKEELATVIRSRTRDAWCAIMEGSDVCFAPVLSLSEAPQHKHNKARKAFVDVGGQLQPAPAPRYSKSKPSAPKPGVVAGTNSIDILHDAGFTSGEIAKLIKIGAVIEA